ncbi:hypothetical protein LTR84_005713 [Exophiala bonariae]|uniref:Enoyl reductase (ER) domain-containing protein n=1 Tax=Exophiala bonariae TaxID=1690606 RepID=A0AAV9N604_9EURO|nr:hypothetical protein LTR84_005713 [Exophiala bonariae]
MKAIVLEGEPGKASVVYDRPFPQLRPGYMLVDVKAVALNPTDWKHIDFANVKKDTLCGCDFAGVVAKTGQGYTKRWKVGDRVCGFAHGGNQLQHEDGAWAETVAVKAQIALKIPDHLSFQDAASLPIGVFTCGQGMVQEMGLDWPNEERHRQEEHVLIYGGSSATGFLGIQFATLAGYRPITTCSPHNFDLLQSLGAVTFDYNDPECVEKIKKHTNNKLRYAWDTISTDRTAKLCADVLIPGGSYGAILKIEAPRPDLKFTRSLGYTAMGEPVEKPNVSLPAQPKHLEFMGKWVQAVEELLTNNKLKVHKVTVDHGLENVFKGLELMRRGKVSGEKLVYTL